VYYDQQLNPHPRHATGWTWSPDFRQLTLRLRSGVTFHTGSAFTSDDVKFNFEHLRDPVARFAYRQQSTQSRRQYGSRF
jgi:peptide/nickel transport system substrate-binding protein